MISIPVGKYNELADLVVELTTRHKALIETNESLAARLAEAGSLLEAVRKGKAFEHDRYLQTTAKLMKAEALLSELYDCGAVTNWLRVSDDLRKRVIEVVRATASARAVQEPPADVFDAMNLPAVGFPTTGEK